MANKRITDLTEKIILNDNDWVEIVDTEDLTGSPQGTSKKAKKSNINSVSVVDLEAKTDKGGYTGTSQDLKDAIDNAVFSGLVTYQTLAEFNAVSPVPADGTPFVIANDPNEANNGNWSVVSGAPVQNANTLANIVEKSNTTKGVTGQGIYNANQKLRLTNRVSNRFEDAFFQNYNYLGNTQSPIFKVTNTTKGVMSEPNELGQRNLIINDPTTANTFVRMYLSLQEMGFEVGDVLSLAVNAQSDTSRGRIYVLFYDENLAQVGAPVYSLLPQSLVNPTDLYINNLTVPTGVVYMALHFERVVNIDDVNFTAIRINEGSEYLEQDIAKPYKEVFLNTQNNLSNYINDVELLVFPEDTNTTINTTNCTVSLDKTINIKNKATYKMQIESSVTATLRMDFINNRVFDKPTAIGFYFYTEDIENITNIGLNVYNQSVSETWSRSIINPCYGGQLKKGWNLFKFATSNSAYNNLGTDCYRVSVNVYTTGAVDLSLASVFLEKEETGKILFVNDHGRKGGWSELVTGQTQTAIQDAEYREMPITYALNPKKIIDSDPLVIDLAALDTIKENATSRFSFHSYNRTATSSMSLMELKADTNNSLRWLTANGFGNPHFRAAFTQNNAPEGVNTLGFGDLKALATSLENTGSNTQIFPLLDRSNITRTALHGKTQSDIDEIFNSLKELGGFSILYTHAIKPDGDTTLYDTTVSEWNYFMSKIDTAKSEGWIELVSYEDLEQKLAKASIEDTDNAIYEALVREIKSLI